MEKETKFEELELSKNIKRALEEAGYLNATEIQARTIPLILEGNDVIGQSQTGTGKTASFGLPIINKIDKEISGVQALVLCPTRELSLQVAQEMRKFTKYEESIKIVAIYGGQDIERQIRDLKKDAKIVIGTPGRIMDHMRRKTLKLDDVKTVVLDEADEMLSMGFEEDIETILKSISEDRQTVLFSATMNTRVMNITKKYQNEPVNVKIKAKELTVENIEQISLDVKEAAKEEILIRLLEVYNPKKCIVFCNTKRKVDSVTESLKVKGFKAEALHSDVKQAQRDRIMKALKQGQFKVLIATDVVARGIDIQELELVINYDVPQEEEYYVHRIGRTGRNGEKGKAFTFVVGKERNKLMSIQRYAKTKILAGKVPTFAEVNKIRNKSIKDSIQKVIDNNEFFNTELVSELISENNNDASVIAKALATMMFTPAKSDTESEFENTEYSDRKSSNRRSKRMNMMDGNVKLFLNLGKKDKIAVKDIIGSITANADVSGSDIGKVNILDKFTFIEVPSEFVDSIMRGMKGKQIKGKNVNIEVANN